MAWQGIKVRDLPLSFLIQGQHATPSVSQSASLCLRLSLSFSPYLSGTQVVNHMSSLSLPLSVVLCYGHQHNLLNQATAICPDSYYICSCANMFPLLACICICLCACPSLSVFCVSVSVSVCFRACKKLPLHPPLSVGLPGQSPQMYDVIITPMYCGPTHACSQAVSPCHTQGWCGEHHPAISASIRPGVGREVLAQATEALGAPLPPALAALYRSVLDLNQIIHAE